MKISKKISIATLILSLIFSGTAAALVYHKYWSKTIDHQFNVIGISAETLVPSFDGYTQKIVADSLTEYKVALVILAENFYNIWLNVTWTTNAQGLLVSMSGQYYDVYYEYMGRGATPYDWIFRHAFDPLDAPFTLNFNEQQIVDKTKMMWTQIEYPTTEADSNHGYCLVVSFNFDTEYVTTPGSYTVSITFDMGFS